MLQTSDYLNLFDFPLPVYFLVCSTLKNIRDFPLRKRVENKLIYPGIVYQTENNAYLPLHTAELEFNVDVIQKPNVYWPQLCFN